MLKVYTLKIPNDIAADIWFKFIAESLSNSNDVECLIVDFGINSFMDTDQLVIIACIIESFYRKGIKLNFRGGSLELNKHLSNIKLKEYWQEGYNRNGYTQTLNYSTLCLWKISADMIYDYSIQARIFFQTSLTEKDLTPVVSNMDEVFNNIFDHSQSPITGYILTQYFPLKRILRFSICDFGIGIPTSLKHSDYELQGFKDCEVIARSLQTGITVQSNPRNRGFGLSHILAFTESSNGKLTIYSNKGVLRKEAGIDYVMFDSTTNFPGTLIDVEIEVDSLESKDDTIEIFDF